MGANPTQAQGVALFLIAFALIAVGMAAGGNSIYILAGVAFLAFSVVRFVKCKPWEDMED